MQRTYILKDILTENISLKDEQRLLIEFWFEENFKNLIYRIIVLNAGQKPMSMRHQIEVLFSTFKLDLEKSVVGLELLDEKDNARRVRARRYTFDRLVSAYQGYLTKNSEIQKENVVAQKLQEEDILSESEDFLGEEYNQFKKYLQIYALLDDEMCRIYNGTIAEIPTGIAWFGSENVMNSFFAATADFGSTPARVERIDKALNSLIEYLKHSSIGEDPLGLGIYQEVARGFNTRKVNIGFATRKLIFNCFKEYFREEGEKPFKDMYVVCDNLRA